MIIIIVSYTSCGNRPNDWLEPWPPSIYLHTHTHTIFFTRFPDCHLTSFVWVGYGCLTGCIHYTWVTYKVIYGQLVVYLWNWITICTYTYAGPVWLDTHCKMRNIRKTAMEMCGQWFTADFHQNSSMVDEKTHLYDIEERFFGINSNYTDGQLQTCSVL